MANWKTINGFSNYEISDKGEVRNKLTQYILKGRLSKSGYYQVNIKNDETGKFINQYIHRLVALHFLDNPDNKKEVNHKDKNKANNILENLEWATSSENQIHSYKLGREKSGCKHIGMFDKDGNLIQEFNSIVEAYQSLNKISRVNIDNALQGKQKTAYGYIWKYLN